MLFLLLSRKGLILQSSCLLGSDFGKIGGRGNFATSWHKTREGCDWRIRFPWRHSRWSVWQTTSSVTVFHGWSGNSSSVTKTICGRGHHYTVHFCPVTSLWELCGGFKIVSRGIVRKGGSRVPVAPLQDFLSRQPTTGGENNRRIWRVPWLWNTHHPLWKIFDTPLVRYPRQDNASNFEVVTLNSNLREPGKYLWLISNDLS